MSQVVTSRDPWQALRALTAARIALGRAGGSLPTHELLDFGLAHAQARDAVLAELDVPPLIEKLQTLGLDVVSLHTAVANRGEYLVRPDLGKRLGDDDRARLSTLARERPACELALVVADGLSAQATQRHAAPVLEVLLPRLIADGWQLGPICVVSQGRVAVEDEIAALLGARMALILLGERPGLTAPDSLGAYVVYDPASARTDADRNCVSNIRPGGLPLAVAADTLHYLLTEIRRRCLSGVAIKDERESNLYGVRDITIAGLTADWNRRNV